MTSDEKPGHKRTGAARPAWLRLLPVLLIALALLAFYAGGFNEKVDWDDLLDRRVVLKSYALAHPFLAAVVFVLIYVSAAVMSLPLATMFTIFGGFLFGWLPALLLVPLSATLGGTLTFLIARGVAGGLGDRIPSRMVEALRRGFARHAFTYLLFLRLAPFCPFVVVNVAPALFRVKLRVFVLATFIGVLPGSSIYAWLGSGLEQAITDAERRGEPYTLASCFTPGVTAALASLALFSLLPVLLRPFMTRYFNDIPPVEAGRTDA